MCYHAQAVLSGQLRRLVVTSPPGVYKSRLWSVCLPAFGWLSQPHLKFMCGANEQELAIRDSLLCRKLIRSQWYNEQFRPDWALSPDQDAKKLFSNTRGGHRQITSADSNVSGKKFDVGIIDDLHDAAKVSKPAYRESDKFWFYNAFWDRQNDFTKSSIVVVAHALHPNDITQELAGRGWPHLHLCERMESRLRKTFPLGGEDPRSDGEYLRPTRFGPAEEKAVKETAGEAVWEGKHQGKPKTVEGSMFPKEKIGAFLPAVPVGFECVRYWDTAATKNATSAHTSGVLIGRYPAAQLPGGQVHYRWLIADVHRGKWSWAERDREIQKTAEGDRWRTNCHVRGVHIEHPGGSGGVQTGEILTASLAGHNVHIDSVVAEGGKVERAGPLSAQWIAGNVDLVAAKWNAEYLDRMENFPGLADKDDTDASSGGFNVLALKPNPQGDPVTKTPPINAQPEGTFGKGKINILKERF